MPKLPAFNSCFSLGTRISTSKVRLAKSTAGLMREIVIARPNARQRRLPQQAAGVDVERKEIPATHQLDILVQVTTGPRARTCAMR